MKRAERLKWLKAYIKRNPSADILNAKFVEDYINATRANFIAMKYGAFKCSQLSRDLSNMYSQGILTRARIGLPGLGQGFPKWVYLYKVAE